MYQTLNDELTDDEIMAIVKGEVTKLGTMELAKIATGDYTPLTNIVRNSVRQICISGGKKEAISYIPYIIAGVISLIAIYFIVK